MQRVQEAVADTSAAVAFTRRAGSARPVAPSWSCFLRAWPAVLAGILPDSQAEKARNGGTADHEGSGNGTGDEAGVSGNIEVQLLFSLSYNEGI